MQAGEICHATLPPELAYGEDGWPPKVRVRVTVRVGRVRVQTLVDWSRGSARAGSLIFYH